MNRTKQPGLVLNVGSGTTKFGDVRLDVQRIDGVTLVADASTALPFRSESFDLVYSRAFFEHCPNPQATLAEFKRVTRPGGSVLIITDNAAFWGFYPRFHGAAGVHSGGYHSHCGVDHHYSIFTLEHLETHFETAGLEIQSKGYLRAAEFEGVGATRIFMRFFSSLLARSGRFGHMRFPHIYVKGVKRREN